MKDIYSFGNETVLTTWISNNSEVVPMELEVFPRVSRLCLFTFRTDPEKVHIPNLSTEFIKDFIAVVANNAESLFVSMCWPRND